jgi:hypothetical protein
MAFGFKLIHTDVIGCFLDVEIPSPEWRWDSWFSIVT